MPATSLHDIYSYKGRVQARSFKVTEKELFLQNFDLLCIIRLGRNLKFSKYNWEKFDQTSLPSNGNFYGNLNLEVFFNSD